MKLYNHVVLARVLTVLLSAISPITYAAAQNAGKVAAVNPDATGTPPGGNVRNLIVGAGVVHKERIQTSAQGSAQIMFPDQSTLNVGHNSSIVIDEYVYNPKTNSGTMLASLSKGVLRFVGGQISHIHGVTVNTPVATLGIRGGVATIAYPMTRFARQLAASDPNLARCSGGIFAANYGTVTVKNKAGETLIRPGFATCVSGSNVPIMEPFRISDALLANMTSTLRSAPGQSGGARTSPAAPFIAANGIGTTRMDNPNHPPGADALSYSSTVGAGNNLVRNRMAPSKAVQIESGFSPPPPPPGPWPTGP